ncbi:MAG: diguanylate cyclase [Desulfarculus sp.]|nr:diguanylate cyclase [Desulfarculus sp.]
MLLVEDSQDDALLILEELKRGGFAPSSRRVTTEQEIRQALASATWDVVLVDYSLPLITGPAALCVISAARPAPPAILLSGLMNEATMEAACSLGCQGYVSKDKLTKLPPMVWQALNQTASQPSQAQSHGGPAGAEPLPAPVDGSGGREAGKRWFHGLGVRDRMLMGAGLMLLGILCIIASGILIINSQTEEFSRKQAELLARRSALHFSGLEIGNSASLTDAQRERLKKIVAEVHAVYLRDLVVVDRNKITVADIVPETLGTAYPHDQGGEVALTLVDGHTRHFEEKSANYPAGIKQVVAPLRGNGPGPIQGALILEYTPEYNANRQMAFIRAQVLTLLALIGFAICLLVGYWAYRPLIIAVPRLAKASLAMAAGDLTTPVGGLPGEMGRLAKALETLRLRLANQQAGLARETDQRQGAEKALGKAHLTLTIQAEELNKRNLNLSLLGEMGGQLQTDMNFSEAAAITADYMPKLLPSWSGGLYLINASQPVYELSALWGEFPPAKEPIEPAGCWALRRRKTHIVVPGETGLVCPHAKARALPHQPHMCEALSAQGKQLALLILQRNPQMNADPQTTVLEADLALMKVISERLALHLANLQLRENLRQQAIRDPLTGLFNRRYLEETLQRELSRAKRQQSPLAVIMADLDHFKVFNDTHGHETGDHLLRAVGQVLMEGVRGEDVACRFGGEEFTLVLPGAGLEAARERAQALRLKVKEISLQVNGQALGPVSMSLGVAVFPEHGQTERDLLAMADAALYLAKDQGRDQVVVSSAQPRTANNLMG